MQNGDWEQYLGKPTRAPLQLHRPISYPRVIIVDVPNPCPCREILLTMSLTSLTCLTCFDLLATFVTGVGEWPGSMAFDDVNVVVQFLGIKGFLLGSICAFVLLVVCLEEDTGKRWQHSAVSFPEYVPILPELKDSHSCLKEWHESPERGWNISKICVAEKVQPFDLLSVCRVVCSCQLFVAIMFSLISNSFPVNFPFFSCDPPERCVSCWMDDSDARHKNKCKIFSLLKVRCLDYLDHLSLRGEMIWNVSWLWNALGLEASRLSSELEDCWWLLRVSLPELGTGVTTFHAQQLAKVDLDVMIARGKVWWFSGVDKIFIAFHRFSTFPGVAKDVMIFKPHVGGLLKSRGWQL